MNDIVLPANIAGFASETAFVNGVGIHYWVGGNPTGPLCCYGMDSWEPATSGIK